MHNVKVIKLCPDNPNCKFIVQKAMGDIAQQFTSLAVELKEKKYTFPRTIVYCMSITSCGEIYSLFYEELEGEAERMYAMYHSRTPNEIQEKVLSSLGKIDGLVRIVFATNALGMGISLPDMRRVIHYGIPRDAEDYLQEVGQGGRDKQKFNAFMFYQPYHVAKCDEAMKTYVRNPTNKCRR